MIRELVDFGEVKRKELYINRPLHDSLILDTVEIIISITSDGKFNSILTTEKETIVEDVIRTEDKGRTSGILPRLLVDKGQYVLGYPKSNKRSKECFEKYLVKLKKYETKSLEPVFKFYKNIKVGFDVAYLDFEKKIKAKEITDSNISFMIVGDKCLLNEKEDLINKIVSQYEIDEKERMARRNMPCAICGFDKYRTTDIATHGVIKRVPAGQSSGCTLVAYNADAFESYTLEGNNNSIICTHCIKNYTEGLNWLMTSGKTVTYEDKKGKIKERFVYNQRKDFGIGSDTAAVFWTKENIKIGEIDLLDEPDPGQIANLYDSVLLGDKKKSRLKNTDRFYSCTLSGAAARIAVRDWIERSLDDIYSSIADWFKDIEIGIYDSNHRNIMPHYTRIFDLARASQRMVSKNKYDDHDTTLSRVAILLWRAALDKKPIPISALTAVLKRIRVDDRGVSPERAALIKLILNRNSNGGEMMNSSVDEKNETVAYVCGRMFCVLENIQRAALGKTNAGIRERFFSSASTNPASAFGRLLKMSQNHLTKLKGDKPGLAVVFDKELQDLFSKVIDFPAIFKLEEQGRFAIGYYHQKHETFRKFTENKDMKEALEDNEINTKGDNQ
jgi:CRISPR-associated protein Csd1